MSLYQILFPSRPIAFRFFKAEQKMCVEFASAMRELTLQGKIPYVWFHIPNEYIARSNNFVFEVKQQHMGKIRGIPDYCFVSTHDSFFIEFKLPKASLTSNQEIFEEWCKNKKIPYFICRSPQEGIKLVQARSNF